MRLREIERGDSLGSRLLIGFISFVSRMRLPDAARVAFYSKDFGRPLAAWTQTAMRAPSAWSIGERELMAAMVAKWNSCAFCLGAHGAVAAKQMPAATVDATLAEFRTAPLSDRFRATLVFLEKMTVRPRDLTPGDVRTVFRAGVTRDALTDAMAVACVFNIVTRYADTLDFAIPTADEFARAANMLLKRGYGAR